MSMPPPATISQMSSETHSSHSSIGPFVAVLVAVMILCGVAVMIGRLCSGRRIMGYGQYDLESWAERSCSSCIDGAIGPPPPPPPSPPTCNVSNATSASGPAATPAQAQIGNQAG